ncbi:MAG: hypothetical protein H7832_09445 [Magnetococcus sp. DMHC-6]
MERKLTGVLLRNSYRVNGKIQHDTIANLSKCSDDEIAAIKFALKNKGQIDKHGPIGPIKTKQGLAIGAVWVFLEIAKRVRIIQNFGTNTKCSVSFMDN